MRRWWNGRHACFRRMCPFGREGSNPFLRILERWPSSVRHRTRNPASGFYSRAGSNPVLSFYNKQDMSYEAHEQTRHELWSSWTNKTWAMKLMNKQDMSYEAHVFSVILFLLLEGHLLGGRSLLSSELLLVQKVAGLQFGFLLPAWLWFLRSCRSD